MIELDSVDVTLDPVTCLLLEEMDSYAPLQELDDLYRNELAAGLALFVNRRLSCAPVTSDWLSVVLVRGLWALGETDLARDYLHDRVPGAAKLGWDKLVFLSRRWPSEMWQLLTSQVIREVDWVSFSAHQGWVVDFRRIRIAEDRGLELALNAAARQLTDSLAPLWDETGGEGVLVLEGLEHWTGEAVSGKGKRSRRPGRTEEIHLFTEQVLQRQQARRGWGTCPQVLEIGQKHLAARKSA